jgi:hypothetical protein
VDKSLLVLFFRKEQKRKTLLFLKKKKQKDFGAGVDKGEVLLGALGK